MDKSFEEKKKRVIKAYLDKKAASETGRESIPGFEYDINELAKLKEIVRDLNTSLSAISDAQKFFYSIRPSSISPDGKLGGNGYIMSIGEMKEAFNSCVKSLSDLSDTLADELKNPLWKDKLTSIEKEDIQDVIRDQEKITDRADTEIEEEKFIEAQAQKVEVAPIEEELIEEEEVTFNFPKKASIPEKLSSIDRKIEKFYHYCLGEHPSKADIVHIRYLYEATGNIKNLIRTASQENRVNEYKILGKAIQSYLKIKQK